MDIRQNLVPKIDDADGEDIELWSEADGNRRNQVRIPSGSKVIAEPMRGAPRQCRVRNVGEGGICLHWPGATVSVNESINLVFTGTVNGQDRRIERVGVVKWYSATQFGIVFRESLLP